MKDPIKVLVRRTGQEPSVEVVENHFKTLQNLVGGNIEMPYNPDFSEGLQIVCNEEGKFVSDPKPNVYWGNCNIIFGDIVFVGIGNEGENISLTPEQITEAKEWIDNNNASDISGLVDGGDLANVILDLYSDINAEINPDKPVKGKIKSSGTEM